MVKINKFNIKIIKVIVLSDEWKYHARAAWISRQSLLFSNGHLLVLSEIY